MDSTDCIFCKIVKNEIPSKKAFENQFNLAFLDIHPISRGHTIVIPKNHYKNIEEIPYDELTRLYKVVKDLSILIHKKFGIDGYNILQNNFEAAGQVINHFHVHIIPRTKRDDRFNIKIPRNQASESDLMDVLKILKN